MGFRRQGCPVAVEKGSLLVRREIVLDPGLAQQCGGFAAPTRGEQRLGVEDPPLPRAWFAPGEEREPVLDRDELIQRVLGARLQRAEARPVRARAQKGGIFREGRRILGLEQPAPAHIADKCGHPRIGSQAGRPIPVAVVGGFEHAVEPRAILVGAAGTRP